MIIAIARECGSGGHEIGEVLANRYKIKLYDKKQLIETAKEMKIYDENRDFYEETALNSLLYAIAMTTEKGIVGKKPFAMLKEIAEKESCVLIGRCANYALRDFPDFTSVFIHGELEDRVERTMKKKQLPLNEALELMRFVDEKRENFHKFYTGQDWACAKNYHLSINSSLTGIEGAADIIMEYIEKKKRTS